MKIIAIGALGGSGTRAVAQILLESGVFMGNDLNHANDNLTFTRLFKNPKWYNRATEVEKNKRIKLFYDLMTKRKLSLRDRRDLMTASITNPIFRNAPINSQWQHYVNTILLGRSHSKAREIWGWKEPNTNMYIEHLAKYFHVKIKYIHVIRHGLDMAFSGNNQQLINWGRRFSIATDKKDSEEDLARKQLDFWIRSNAHTINVAKRMLGNDFYVLNYESFCEHPKIEVSKLLNFVGLDIDPNSKEKLFAIPTKPSSHHRYLKRDISIFSTQQLNEVMNYGFSI